MRTDSAAPGARVDRRWRWARIKLPYSGSRPLPEKPSFYKSSNKAAQEAL
ncbi:MAG: hypothetical protein R3B57_12590 [Phycisphaerales bacterium]